MTPTKPYLTRAFYDWIVDNSCTPYLLVDANADQVQVPRQFVEDNKIILNISPKAVQGLSLGNDFIAFSARFSGIAQEVFVPIPAVLAIYAKENGQGMLFNKDDEPPNPPDDFNGGTESESINPVTSKKPSLKVVK